MYQETSEKQQRKHRRLVLGALVVVCLLVVCGVTAYGGIKQSLKEQAALSVRESILESAKQCCAVEGSYPFDLEHLEEHYGLTVNHDDYIITYQAFASNIVPSVVVVPR